jgi:hypothetical protein
MISFTFGEKLESILVYLVLSKVNNFAGISILKFIIQPSDIYSDSVAWCAEKIRTLRCKQSSGFVIFIAELLHNIKLLQNEVQN